MIVHTVILPPTRIQYDYRFFKVIGNRIHVEKITNNLLSLHK